jgi:4-hydroxyacetophenone monooxygenase
LGSHIAFNSKVAAAEWQTDLQAYKITIEDARSGTRTTSIAEVILSAHGLLHIPNMPPIPGLDSFKGPLFHSSQWDTSLDLSGKRVAVIGNGGSAYVIPFGFAICDIMIFDSLSLLFRPSATKLVHKLSLTS